MLSESAYWLEDDDEHKEQILRVNDAMQSAKRARYLNLRQRLHSH